VNRTNDDLRAESAAAASATYDWASPWEPWLKREAAALSNRDGSELIELSRDVPQVWRRSGGSAPLAHQLEQASTLAGRTAFGHIPLVATHYAGTYLGIQQALDVDSIRQAIEEARRAGAIGSWSECVLTTALLSAMSAAAFSPGKHFAQAHAIHRRKDLTFQVTRILEDRTKDIRSLFRTAASEVEAFARPAEEGHEVLWAPVEALSKRHWFAKAAVIYADPPYTAQQYSRFYHVPEIVLNYRVPVLDLANGAVTRGLYPIGRFKSAFSSKRQAPGAFQSLCQTASDVGANLVISYSSSSTGKTGNDRMIDLEELTTICARHFPRRVQVLSFGHSYRQFNGSAFAVDGRRDPECLIVCRAHTS
jgi:adenine-specific DNA methylase